MTGGEAKTCANCGLVADERQLSGVTQQCPQCGQWVIWHAVERTRTSARPARTDGVVVRAVKRAYRSFGSEH